MEKLKAFLAGLLGELWQEIISCLIVVGINLTCRFADCLHICTIWGVFMSILETERLILRPFKEGDAESMYKSWTSDSRVAEYCRWYTHENISATEYLLKMYLDEAEKGFEYRWAITLRGKDKPIGCIDIVDTEEMELGYVISYDCWNKGLMTEAVKAVIDELFRMGFDRITARHAVDNPASGRVMEKCGMKYIKNDTTNRKFGSDELCEVKCYEIKRS